MDKLFEGTARSTTKCAPLIKDPATAGDVTAQLPRAALFLMSHLTATQLSAHKNPLLLSFLAHHSASSHFSLHLVKLISLHKRQTNSPCVDRVFFSGIWCVIYHHLVVWHEV